MLLRRSYDDNLAAATYLIGCQRTGEAILIDPLRDIDRYIKIARTEGLRIIAVAETHIHADFLSGARELAEQTGATVYLSDEGGPDWRYEWLDKRSIGGAYPHVLLKNGSKFSIGNIEFEIIHTPGHTPEHIVFVVTDRGSGATEPMGIASGDFLFVGDVGRPDLLETAAGQAGTANVAAHTLFHSIQKLRSLPAFMQVWPAHGAGSACGKALGAVPMSTIGYELRFNPALLAATSEGGFVEYILAGQSEPPFYFGRMKHQNKVGPKILGALPEPKSIHLSELKEMIDRDVVMIDTRPWDSYRQGHIKGTLFHPFNRSFVTDVGSLAGENPEICLICVEDQVGEIVRNLVRIGLDRVVCWVRPSLLDDYKKDGGALVQTKEQTASELREMVKSKSVNVLDVRRLSEFGEGHIPGAQNIAHTRLASKLSEVPRDKPLLVHCQGGARSAYVCGLLEHSGINVINLKGGMLAWEKAGLQVER